MHSFLENVGLPNLKIGVNAATSLVDQHAKPSCFARNKFATSSSNMPLQHNATDEDTCRRGLREAAGMAKKLQIFATKVLRRNGLDLADDLFRSVHVFVWGFLRFNIFLGQLLINLKPLCVANCLRYQPKVA